ncbi:MULTISPECIES: DHA2 family efflux MFS transporter permease subunit [unclassified Neisseria]|uniref:DHA2 family efflux MFS transporter permease subunit n=1 Tax=unclassified Neisseria TaxID=2623750 RepID=UPI0026653FC1|nr:MULTISPECIES: DHA2 family efflux MFS transporter permease subunit [unclassified Neisseria]MDO1510216.1 DHA2 family efflux MFS transporter permease subunit [Neisseria sp. MVDL19-042950]MDO1516385.1 DHA2 family efflux MFS transporter permease subunit [Neisseria sp. MVDL18-041461]MDO1563533.1 DHA2 family efflux MFS transporter permease subunit [Neisseria sp. MVDL20-010259]
MDNIPMPTPSRWLPMLLAIAIFMQMLDATILNTALPKMAVDLNESPLNMQSAIIAYVLTLALLIPLSGYLVDRFGTRNVFVAAMGLFMTGSLLCAAAPNLTMLVIARIVQGLGGSMLAPVPRLTLMKVYDKSQLLNAINYAVMPALIGPVVGPLVGGYLVEYASWHWIFLLNLPIGALGIWMSMKIMPNIKGERGRFDMLGFLLFAVAACFLSLSVELVTHPNALLFSALTAIIGIAALWLYREHAKHDEDPLYAAHLFQVRTFRLGLIGNLASRLGISSIPFLLPLLFQVAFGFSASLSGWLVAPVALASLLVKPLIKPIMTRFGYRNVLVANTRILGLLIMAVALPVAETPLWLWVVLLLAMGVCNSIQFSAMNTLTIADLRPYQTGSGNSLMAVNQQLAMSFGIALGALMLQWWSQSGLIGPNLHTAFRCTFIGTGTITLLSSLIFTRLHRSDGSSLTSVKKG